MGTWEGYYGEGFVMQALAGETHHVRSDQPLIGLRLRHALDLIEEFLRSEVWTSYPRRMWGGSSGQPAQLRVAGLAQLGNRAFWGPLCSGTVESLRTLRNLLTLTSLALRPLIKGVTSLQFGFPDDTSVTTWNLTFLKPLVKQCVFPMETFSCQCYWTISIIYFKLCLSSSRVPPKTWDNGSTNHTQENAHCQVNETMYLFGNQPFLQDSCHLFYGPGMTTLCQCYPMKQPEGLSLFSALYSCSRMSSLVDSFLDGSEVKLCV